MPGALDWNSAASVNLHLVRRLQMRCVSTVGLANSKECPSVQSVHPPRRRHFLQTLSTFLEHPSAMNMPATDAHGKHLVHELFAAATHTPGLTRDLRLMHDLVSNIPGAHVHVMRPGSSGGVMGVDVAVVVRLDDRVMDADDVAVAVGVVLAVDVGVVDCDVDALVVGLVVGVVTGDVVWVVVVGLVVRLVLPVDVRDVDLVVVCDVVAVVVVVGLVVLEVVWLVVGVLVAVVVGVLVALVVLLVVCDVVGDVVCVVVPVVVVVWVVVWEVVKDELGVDVWLVVGDVNTQ